MDASKTAVKAILVTLGAAFVLLSVIEWKKLVDLVPSNNTSVIYAPVPDADQPYTLTCKAFMGLPASANGVQPAGSSLDDCQKVWGTNVPWTQGIKAFVYSWIGIGLLVAAFIKPKGAGVAGGGYW